MSFIFNEKLNIAEGVATTEEYIEVLQKRAEARAKINEYEKNLTPL